MKNKILTTLMAFAAMMLSARAEILMYEGFPTGEGGYPTTSSTAINGLTVTPAESVAFDSSAQYWAGNYVNSPGAYAGLSYPAAFDSATYPSYAGAATLCATVGHAPNQMRQAIRQFSSGVFKERTGKVYFRMLMQADETALGRLTGADGIVALNHYAAGLLYDRVRGGLQYATESLYSSLNAGTSRNAIYYLAFGFVKAADGSLSAALLVRGADDVRSVYPILTSVVPGETYICLAEIDLNAGTDGKEKVRAMIQPVSNYNPKFLYATLGATDTIEVDIVNSSCYLDVLLAEEGLLHTNNGVVKFDEFGVATTADDLVYIQSAAGSKTVMVAGNPSGIGTPDPDYGIVSDVEVGTTFSCGDDFFKDGVMHSCTGYTYETRDEQGAWSEPEVRTEKSFVMDDSALTVRITWQWAPVAYRVAVTTHGSGSESVTFGADPVAPLKDGEGTLGGYFAAGEVLSVSAVDGAGADPCEFLSWSGDVESNERTIAVTPSAPLSLVANFKTHWKYDSEAGTLSDGNWTLTCGAYQDADITVEAPLMITGATAGNGVLDLEAINNEISGGTVRAIGEAAFKSRTDLTALKLSPSVVFIGKEAFINSGIANLPDFSHVVEVGDNAFQGCADMKGQPDFSSLVTVRNQSFDSTGLTGDLLLPELTLATYASFSKAAFTGKIVAPKLVTIPQNFAVNLKVTSAEFESATSVGNTAFSGCSKLVSIKLSPNVKTFVSACFNGCSSLVEMDPAPFGPSVETVGYRSFAGTAFTNLVFGESFVAFDAHSATDETSDAFNGSKVQSVDLGATSLTGLRTALFRDCYQLEHVVLPATVDEIGAQAFGAANAVDKLLVVDCAGEMPTTVSDLWADNPDNNGVSRPNRDWKMVVRVKAKHADSWMADEHFVALKDIPDVESKPNYERIGEFKKVVGAWRNMWLSVERKGFTILVM